MYSKYKIPEYQNGHAYLTSHRACYVDNEDPRTYAVAIDLKDVDKVEHYVCIWTYVVVDSGADVNFRRASSSLHRR